jgi:hypothetical protein
VSSKPTVKEIEEYMASLNIPLEQGLNGTAAQDLDPLYDVISKPKHYMLFAAEDLHKDQGIEVRDVIEKLVGKFGNKGFEFNYPANSTLFESDYVQLMQYLMRFMDKNGVEDLKKARWYLDKMIEAY